MHLLLVALFFAQMRPASPLLENEFVQVFRKAAPCATAVPSCGERVFVALGSVELNGQKMERGDIRVFKTEESYSAPKSGEFLEVIIKPGHPKVASPAAGTPPPPGNKVLYDGKDFTVFEEKMQPGEKSVAHSHNQRVAIFLNRTLVQQWTGGSEETRELVPDTVSFRPAVVHISKDVGKIPIRNLLIEFKP
ncbi:MAG: hypothetical protein LAO08_11195 [Acidobacteriia bacterium]|nr:hypothetical protein [Terriglobia bacterium]